jgi:cytochrome c
LASHGTARTLAAMLAFSSLVTQAHAQSFPGIGRAATAAEIAAWDIDVRPDFKGLPKGSGSVKQGQRLWDERCATCHGTFGESNEVFPPIVGHTTAEDVRTGRVKALTEPVGRTTLMKLSSLSALWDYINRAMPWDRPKSLTPDEVYASVAYILHLGDLVPADFVLSDRNVEAVQSRLPNRHGMVRYEPMWRVRGAGDVRNTACMRNCESHVVVSSTVPEYARDAHGNLALQHRAIGPVRGIDTSGPATSGGQPKEAGTTLLQLATSHNCMACHRIEGRLVGPSFADVAARYATTADAAKVLAKRIKEGSSGSWGAIPMPPNAGLSDKDLNSLAEWIVRGAK